MLTVKAFKPVACSSKTGRASLMKRCFQILTLRNAHVFVCGKQVRSGAGLHHAENQPHAWRGAINGIILERYTNCVMEKAPENASSDSWNSSLHVVVLVTSSTGEMRGRNACEDAASAAVNRGLNPIMRGAVFYFVRYQPPCSITPPSLTL